MKTRACDRLVSVTLVASGPRDRTFDSRWGRILVNFLNLFMCCYRYTRACSVVLHISRAMKIVCSPISSLTNCRVTLYTRVCVNGAAHFPRNEGSMLFQSLL
uniref:Uncharacterized protein n=1 Tax=Setaria viridis TaxID=4556 RepID=A0A4U6TJ27_SETVI|nr:hypothetical protein SEVIR_9G487600v2 [Setaria viridis]